MTEINWVERAAKYKFCVCNFIDGQYMESRGKDALFKYSPRDGSLLYEFSVGDAHEVDKAVASAKAALSDGRWSGKPVQERQQVLRKLADLIEVHADELALLDCLDVGKPITHALSIDIPLSLKIIRYNAEAADKLFDKAHTDAGNLVYQLRSPVGVVGGITGWNFPLMLAAMKVGPALAMGNSLVLKPSEITLLSTTRLAKLAVEAGLPPGVFNVVHGSGTSTGAALARHPDVDMLTFTGSSVTGKTVMIYAGQSNMKRLHLECGGKSPNIIFDDCPEDLNAVADAVVASAFGNQGENCKAGTRLLVQKNIKDKLLPIVLEKTARLTPNDPLDPTTKFGALVSETHMNKVLNYIKSGSHEGAKLMTGGQRVLLDHGGYYLTPAVFDDVRPDQKIAQEEIFGPVLSVISFCNEEEAIKIANNTRFGLAAFVWTQSLSRAQRMAQRLDAGLVIIQSTTTPSPGGVVPSAEGQKESGFGKEYGLEGLESYTVSSCIQLLI